MLKTLAAFYSKCGVGDPLAGERFGKPSKGVALSRLAVWASIADPETSNVATAFTPGQLATICDAAPAIVGEKAVAYLDTVQSLADLDAFVRSTYSSWETGVMTAAQTWSVFHLGNGKFPVALFRNSELNAEDYATLGVVARCLASGDIARHPEAVYAALANGFAAHIADAAAEGTPSPSPATFSDEAATFIAFCRSGAFRELGRSGLLNVQSTIEEYSLRAGEYIGKSSAVNGGFPGVSSYSELRARSLENCRLAAEGDTLSGVLSRLPAGQAILWEAGKYSPADTAPSDDLLMAGMRGYFEAIEHYSPIITPGLSMTDVRKTHADHAADDATPTLPGFDNNTVAPPKAPLATYSCSRFPAAFTDAWGRKRFLLAAAAEDFFSDASSLKLRRKLHSLATDIMEGSEMPFDAAIHAAADEMRRDVESADLSPSEKTERLMDITAATSAITHGTIISLDAALGENERRSRYDLIPDEHAEDWQREDFLLHTGSTETYEFDIASKHEYLPHSHNAPDSHITDAEEEAYLFGYVEGVTLNEAQNDLPPSVRDSQESIVRQTLAPQQKRSEACSFEVAEMSLSDISAFPASFESGIDVSRAILVAGRKQSLVATLEAMAIPGQPPPTEEQIDEICTILKKRFPGQSKYLDNFAYLLGKSADVIRSANLEQTSLDVGTQTLGSAVLKRVAALIDKPDPDRTGTHTPQKTRSQKPASDLTNSS